MFALPSVPSVPECGRAANTFKANSLFERKVKCHRRGRSSNTPCGHELGLCRAVAALQGVSHEHGEPLRFGCSWEDTGSEYEHADLLIIDPCFPFFGVYLRFKCSSALCL